jgi:tetratricopeptide (TPR) repeat protein
MQQYRVNYSLLIGLLVGTLVCSGAVYGLWKFQMERKSGWLISEAKKAREAGETRDAAQFYRHYLSIHSDDTPAKMDYAHTLLDVTERDDATMLDFRETLFTLENMLRNPKSGEATESKNVRERLVALYGRVQNHATGLEHINMMLEADPANVKLQAQRAEFLAKSKNLDEAIKYSYRLIGYDPRTDKFDAKTATAPNEPQVYSSLAALVRGKENRPELADRILDRMVEVNPKSAEAYIQRGRLRSLPAWGENLESARADAEKAYQLKPDDLDVLLFMQDIAARDEQFAKASEYIEKAKKLHPKEVRPYQAAAALEMKQYAAAKGGDKQKHFDKAIAQINQGLKNVTGSKAIELLIFKAELQIPTQDITGARETIRELGTQRNLRAELLDYFEARILLAEGKWLEASKALNRVRPQMAEFGRERAMEIDFSLGLCYERLGRYDLAKEQYMQVLQQDPQNEPAKAGALRADTMRGVESKDVGGADQLQEKIADMLKKPKAEQDWPAIDAEWLKMAKERQLDETTIKLGQAQMLVMRQDYDGAAKLLGEARNLSPKSLPVHRSIIQLARINPKVGPAKAMEVLNRTVEQFGDLPALRLDKADILIQMNKSEQDREPLKRELANLFAGIDQWSDAQKIELWGGMAGRYLNLNMPVEARQNLALSADKQPNELPLRLALFTLALEAGDDAGMQEAQAKILQIVGDTNDSNWLFAEARRKLVLLRRGRLPREALGEIRKLAEEALKQRGEWSDLQVLLAEIELMSNNQVQALEYYDRAQQLGRPPATSVAQHIRLLVANGRYADAGKLLDRIPEGARQPLLGALYAEILFRTNQTDEALKQALAATESNPDHAPSFYWYGQLLARSSQAGNVTPEKRKEIMGKAIKATERAAELQPEFPDAWFALINYHAMQKDEGQAQKTLRDAQLALSGDNLQIFLARSYEVLHRWFDAETMYREIYETDPSDINRAQQLAAFYLGPIYQRADQLDKVAPLLNQILKAGAEKKIPANDGNLLWARRMAARIFARTNQYPNLLKAEKLLASNSQDGNLLIDDKLAMADILASRPEPVSRLKAIGLLEEVSKVQPLSEGAEIQLADLYFAVHGFTSKYKNQIELAYSRFPNSAAARLNYATKLIADGRPNSLTEAVKQVNKLRELAPNNPATFNLTVRLAGKLGRQQQVRDDLLRRLPNIQQIKDLDQNTASSLAGFASLFVALGDLDSAEKVYTDLAARNPIMVFELAKFLGEHRDPEKCFAKLHEVYKPSNVNEVISVALGVARARRDKIGDKYDADIQRWLDAALRENPDSIPLLVTQADMYDVQKKYEEAAEVYRKLLARTDLVDYRRAVVLNNLAFLLALDTSAAKSTSDDPLKLVEEAADILGPNSDILDTRAVVRVSQKDYQGAIRDLELAVTDGATASKYYHKAVAHLYAGENKAAAEAWQKAEELGLNRDSINRMEHDQYEELKKKVDQIRGKKVTRTDSPSRTGSPVVTTAP